MTATHTTTSTQIAPGVWDVDPAHTTAQFVARHLMVAKVRGRVNVTSGEITIGEHPLDSSVRAALDAASIDTRDETRDAHLRSPDFLDTERFPTIEFASTGLRESRDGDYVLTGDLTIRGVTRPVELRLEYLGSSPDPWGGTRAGFSASTEINRRQWGLEWNVALETGGVLVSDKVRLEIEAEAVRRA